MANYILVIQKQAHGMTDKVLSSGLEAKLLEHIVHGCRRGIDALPSLGVGHVVLLDKLEKVFGAVLLKGTHQVRCNRLHLGRGELKQVAHIVDE